jgi:hypothetical protein
MSSTARGGVREESDFYETRRQDSIGFVQHLAERFTPRVICEPMAGRGALVKVMREVWPHAHIIANELNAERASKLAEAGADEVFVGDMFRQGWLERLPNIDLTLTNPAFLFSEQCAKRMIPVSHHAAFLQRLGWLATVERLPFWKAQKYDFGILARRPHFAASLKCGKHDRVGKKKVPRPCGWAVIQYLDDPRPKTCPGCRELGSEEPVDVSTSDSADYCWYDFYAESLNQHFHLGKIEQAEQGDLLKGVA